MKTNNLNKNLILIGLLFLFSLILRVSFNSAYGFHRDEFLYLDMANHLDWGYWSNPPSIGFFSWLTQTLIGDSVTAFRFFPNLLGAFTVAMSAWMARDLGGNLFAQFLAGFSIIVATAFPRVFLMYNPVPFDVFYWTLFGFLIVRYIRTESYNYLYLFGLAIGLGFLNKYSVIFYVLAVLGGLLLTKHRKLFFDKHFYGAIALAIAVCLPNVLWQWQHDFVVFQHMEELAATQLVNVNPIHFLTDQILFNISVVHVWIAGLIFLIVNKELRDYRILAFIFLIVLTCLFILRGKSYYTLGIFPMLISAGAVGIEKLGKTSLQKSIFRSGTILLSTSIFLFVLPFSIPYLSLEKMIHHCQKASQQTIYHGLLRWEDGEVHHLPQDFADMLGWEELGEIVGKTYQSIPQKENCAIYCENFGQAGAISYYGKKYDLPTVLSFADSYRIWSPKNIPSQSNIFIYVNDEIGDDVIEFFGKVEKVGAIQNPHAREYETSVWLCQKPKSSLAEFWKVRYVEIVE